MCGSPIFIRAPGIRHSAFARSNSDHSAARNSPGRTKIGSESKVARRTLSRKGKCARLGRLYPTGVPQGGLAAVGTSARVHNSQLAAIMPQRLGITLPTDSMISRIPPITSSDFTVSLL